MSRRFRNCVGPQVRKLRIAKGLTQDQFSARLQLAGLHSIDRVALAKIESRLRSAYDYEVVVIASELGADPNELLPKSQKLKDDLDDLISGKRQ